MRGSLRAVACGLLALAGAALAQAAGKETHQYRVLGTWFDEDTLYVLYGHYYARYPVVSLEIRATPVESRVENFIVTLPRAALAGGSARLKLEGGARADFVEYRDRDVTFSRVGETWYLAGRAGKTPLPECVWQYWRGSGVVRLPDGIFVCGVYADREGRVKAQMTRAAVEALGARLGKVNQSGPGSVATAAPTLAATFANGKLLLITDWTMNRPASLQVAALAPDKLDAPAFLTTGLGARSAFFGLRTGSTAYAPGGVFVVDIGTREAPAYAVCDLDACTPLALPARTAALLVDHPQREVFWFGGGSAASTELDVRRLTY